MKISSNVFKMEKCIPVNTCVDENISPPIDWKKVPEGTVSMTVICDDLMLLLKYGCTG